MNPDDNEIIVYIGYAIQSVLLAVLTNTRYGNMKRAMNLGLSIRQYAPSRLEIVAHAGLSIEALAIIGGFSISIGFTVIWTVASASMIYKAEMLRRERKKIIDNML